MIELSVDEGSEEGVQSFQKETFVFCCLLLSRKPSSWSSSLAPSKSRYPDNFRMVCSAFIERKIPAAGIPEALHVPVEKEELCAPRMQVGVDESERLTTAPLPGEDSQTERNEPPSATSTSGRT